MNVTDNHFVSDFFHLNQESSRFEIPVELSFQNREFIFHELSSWINNVIELASHFLTVSAPDNIVFPGTNWHEGLPGSVDELLQNRSFIHDVTIGLSGFVTLLE